MKCSNINDIMTDITKTVIGFYREGDSYADICQDINYLESIIEIVSFLFEEYRNDFDEMMVERYGKELSEDALNIERLIVISMISHKILNEIRTVVNQKSALKTVEGIGRS